jgi:hypothetical protein
LTTIQQAVEAIDACPRIRGLSVASVLGKTFDSRDLATLMEQSRDLDDQIEKLLHEGIIEEDRESRGDRLTFASGIVRDVLYAALSRRKRRSLHRKYAELIEQRYAGRLERIYPELVHHYSQADVPEKTVDYGLRRPEVAGDLQPRQTVRVAKVTLEYLEDGGPAKTPRGRGRMLLSRGHRMTGNVDGVLRERRRRGSSRPRNAALAVAAMAHRGGSGVAVAPRRAGPASGWSAAFRRRAEETPSTSCASSPGGHGREHAGRVRALTEYRGGDREARAGRRPSRPRSPPAERSSSPWRTRSPQQAGHVPDHRRTRAARQHLRDAGPTDAGGNLAPLLCERARSRTRRGPFGST